MDHLKFILTLTASVFMWLFIKITAHEMSHAVVGKFVGFTPYAIRIGSGSLLWKFSISGVEVSIHVLPRGGFTYVHKPKLEKQRWSGALFSLAGIAADCLLLCLLIFVAIRVLREGWNMGLASFIVWYLVMFQALAIFFSLWPRDIPHDGATHPNDAKLFLRYASGELDKALREASVEYEASVRQYEPQFRIENSWFKADMRHSLRALASLASELEAKHYEPAVEQYLELLKSPSLTKGERARFLDHMAGISLINGEHSFSERSLAWAKEAHELFPNLPTLRGTYGGALVESGHYAEGIELLTPLTSEENQPIDRSISACYLAKAYHHLGNSTQSKSFLELGKLIGGSQGVCERIEAELVKV